MLSSSASLKPADWQVLRRHLALRLHEAYVCVLSGDFTSKKLIKEIIWHQMPSIVLL